MFKNLFRKKILQKFYEKKDFCKFRIFINYLDRRFLQIYSKKKPESIFISPQVDFIWKVYWKNLTFTWLLLGKIC